VGHRGDGARYSWPATDKSFSEVAFISRKTENRRPQRVYGGEVISGELHTRNRIKWMSDELSDTLTRRAAAATYKASGKVQ